MGRKSQMTAYERLTTTKNGRRMLVREQTILEVTEMICSLMDASGVTRSELARRMGKTKAAVSQMLDGERNLTLKSVSDMLFALDKALVADCREFDEPATVPPAQGGQIVGQLMHVKMNAQYEFPPLKLAS